MIRYNNLVVGKDGNNYQCQNLCDSTVHTYDVSILRLFELVNDKDPLLIATFDHNGYQVSRILNHKIGTVNHKKSYEFEVEFISDHMEWLPYMEYRWFAVLDMYLTEHPEAKKLLGLK